MRWSATFIPTLKEQPAEAEVASHRLMLRAGLMRKLASGTYTYLPLGHRVLLRVTAIVREEMNRAGALEILMPVLHPAELWQRTGRYEAFDVLMRLKDRSGRDFVLGPTHEEVVTDLVSREVSSYRQLPFTLYQIQTKLRDEPRPRFGVLRTREFIMKDAYSFDVDAKGLDRSYQAMYDAYCRIFTRCGLPYVPVVAHSGAMGGDVSHEFMVPCQAGEDKLVTCDKCRYAANLEKAEPRPLPRAAAGSATPQTVATPGLTTIEQVSRFLGKQPWQLVKTMLYKANGSPVAVLVRGDHAVNELKLSGALKSTVEMADPQTIEKVTGAPVGFAGPIGLGVPIYADRDVASVADFVVGANKADAHIVGVNAGRDFAVTQWIDARMVIDGDGCPHCPGTLTIRLGIEVGHVFKLGLKYSKALDANFSDEQGQTHPIVMGCYGIGINRIIAAAIERSCDEAGIIWPVNIAPYDIEIIALNMEDGEVVATAQKLHDELSRSFDVLLDDRQETPGFKFKDADLVGIPVHIVVGRRALKGGQVEIKLRGRNVRLAVPIAQAASAAAQQVDALRSEISQRLAMDTSNA